MNREGRPFCERISPDAGWECHCGKYSASGKGDNLRALRRRDHLPRCARPRGHIELGRSRPPSGTSRRPFGLGYLLDTRRRTRALILLRAYVVTGSMKSGAIGTCPHREEIEARSEIEGDRDIVKRVSGARRRRRSSGRGPSPSSRRKREAQA